MSSKESRLFIGCIVILLIFIAFGGYKHYALSKEYRTTKLTLETELSDTKNQLVQTEYDRNSLNEALAAEQQKNEEFEDQINDLTKKVGGLVKLSRIDPELLQKYSKVFFLSENYVPSRLTTIDSKYTFPETRVLEFHAQAWPFLLSLLDAAEDEGLKLKVMSAFRSFETQSSLKANYKVIYGAGTANQFSADQGYSEHQLGTAVDFTTPTVGTGLNGFELTPEYKWLRENAHRYGFVLSYVPNNVYYIFEPWHWRFVGTDLASDLHEDNKNFYELDQRTLDKYLGKIFDK
ncbi:MAG TPA: D-alanyl-D-alanine carboxypeptidase family protein [Candidatus Nanoarchaeia archaeon]|nr:D-alanyl-D-alanine carboxypeptidase family protein [Candidatus Nanoarchaeia archaeon]